MMYRILLLSAYDTDSHRSWCNGLVKYLSDWHWTALSLPPRFFNWRIHGNPLSWAFSQAELLNCDYDVVIATSMCDLAVLRGLVPKLASTPAIIYFHENQFAYPMRTKLQRDHVHLCMHDLYNALCADIILFNSKYNRDSLLDGVDALLQKMPDCVPHGIAKHILDRSKILPVPIDPEFFEARSPNNYPHNHAISILWNHRWEYDKAPERLFLALDTLKQMGVDFRLHVVGRQFRQSPPIFAQAQRQFAEHIDSWGYLSRREDYHKLLKKCDIAVSTAIHEFQGLALLEATASGCRPVAPCRLAYRECLPPSYLYPSSIEQPQTEAKALALHISQLASELDNLRHAPPLDISSSSWLHASHTYRLTIESICKK
jgi:glycosyltransferase involved in cell wall biosynthesis